VIALMIDLASEGELEATFPGSRQPRQRIRC
jgi:hypothetical protein